MEKFDDTGRMVKNPETCKWELLFQGRVVMCSKSKKWLRDYAKTSNLRIEGK